MADTDKYLYTLQSCNPSSYSDIVSLAVPVTPSNYSGLIVSIVGQPQAETYLVVSLGLNSGLSTGWMPPLLAARLTSCADPDADKMYRVTNCQDPKSNRQVKLVAAQTIGDVLRFDGECTCWIVSELISTYDEVLTIAATYSTCSDCQEVVAAENCLFEERTIGYAVKVTLPKDEPPDRGYAECCNQGLVLASLSDTDPYMNDFTTIYFQRQTPADTVIYQIIGSMGTVALVDGTHGVLYDFDPLHTNTELSYFMVEWRKILNIWGEDTFTLRKVVTIAGIAINVDTPFSYKLENWTINKANGTTRIDCKQDGKLEAVDIDFKDSGFEHSLRLSGYFGNPQDKWVQENLIFSQKKGLKMFEGQITMSNNKEYVYQANNIPECMARELRDFILFSNELFISDYNKNNHSYRYELLPVVMNDSSGNEFEVLNRAIWINLVFTERSKNNRKTNC